MRLEGVKVSGGNDHSFVFYSPAVIRKGTALVFNRALIVRIFSQFRFLLVLLHVGRAPFTILCTHSGPLLTLPKFRVMHVMAYYSSHLRAGVNCWLTRSH